MPELPEVETVRRGLAPVMDGARITDVELRRPDLRFPFPEGFTAALKGATVETLGRRAKYLLMPVSSGNTAIMHLGMSGRFIIENGASHRPGQFHHASDRIAAHDHVVFHLNGGARIVYNDPRRFGFMTLAATPDLFEHPLLKNLGVEPTGNALTPAYLADRFAGKVAPLKATLLDQRIIAGLGNIYVCEALHRARLSPRRAAGTLVLKSGKPSKRIEALTDAIRAVIADAIAAGGSSLRDYVHADGTLGYFQHTFRVYDREDASCPTPNCRGIVRRIVQSGRSTFYCPECQR